ncbi:MAG TPA: NAD-dependent epimerase/dehydratase family protein [Tepidisphaeraceae bacterium]|jgi:dTDP-4-dehydrorhamnose reductase|nr:NAD-dependent epimerase/dehydratase family protein [Tepidisphaeraceae bacterium]
MASERVSVIDPRTVDSIGDVEQLEDFLSAPTGGVVESMRKLKGDVLILGAGGKMGPSLARMVKRASQEANVQRRVIGVSRFSSGGVERQLRQWGISTLPADLLDREELKRLPDVENVIYMAGMKFGSSGNEPMTWAMNSYLPGMVCERFAHSRIVAFSTGNVYGLVKVKSGGSVESDLPDPVGEYAMSCLGRERIFQYFGEKLKIPVTLLRLNYAVELRYGVLLDLAQRIAAGQPVDVAMGHVNVIWQGDANAMAIQSFDHAGSPPKILNLAGPEVLKIREVAEELGQLLGKPVKFSGNEAGDALLSNAGESHKLFGGPRIGAKQVVRWVADWVKRRGVTLEKPTHFDSRDGKF